MKCVVFFRWCVLLCALLINASCGSRYRACRIDTPCTALERAREDASHGILYESEEWIPCDWWLLFNDPQLAEFIQTAFIRNPTLHEAHANILLAAANADRVRASLFPHITWGADVSRQKLSETGVIPFGQSTTVPIQGTQIPVYFTQYETQLNLSYEFDFWGKNKNMLRAALGELEANRAEEAFTRLLLSVAIAQTYYELQINYKREQIAKALVENRTKFQKLIDLRSSSIDTRTIVNTNNINVSTAVQALSEVQTEVAINEYQLRAYLAGNFEEEIVNIPITECTLPKIPLPCALPLHLLSHRPDIAAQLWLIQSAGRLIDVARAGFYPDINLTAFFGFQTIHFRELFKWPSTYFNVNPAFSLPIFEGGRLLANLHMSEVNYDIEIFQYNNLVLKAVQEVLSSLAVIRDTEVQFKELKSKFEFQQANFRLTTLRENNQINSTLDYLTSEQNMLLSQDRELVAFGKMILSVLSLIKALGGGYEAYYC